MYLLDFNRTCWILVYGLHYYQGKNKLEPKRKETTMLKDILKKLETEGDLDAMIRGEISTPWPPKAMVDKLTKEEASIFEAHLLSDSRLFKQNK